MIWRLATGLCYGLKQGITVHRPVQCYRFCLVTRCYSQQRPNKASRGKQLIKWLALFTASVTTISLTEVYFKRKQRVKCDEPAVSDGEFRHRHVFVKGTKLDLHEAINLARNIVETTKAEVGSPGMVVGVSVDGEVVWKEGFGYSDVENHVLCTPDTVMRIASISKSMTMLAVGKLIESGLLDLDKPVQHYVPSFPEKKFEGEKVTITTRQLVSHVSGIRHYDKNPPSNNTPKSKDDKNKQNESKKAEANKAEANSSRDEAYKEFFNKEKYETVTDALSFFKDDPLIYKPGKKYLYTTHGFTLLSAVVEGAAKESFTKLMKTAFNEVGLQRTYLDENEPLIYNRSRYYVKKAGRIVNAPYADNSYKWAGGGFVSTAGDLLKFGNAMLYSFQYTSPSDQPIRDEKSSPTGENTTSNSEKLPTSPNTKVPLPGYLKQETVKMLWSPLTDIPSVNKTSPIRAWYGMGWVVVPEQQYHGFCHHKQFCVAHSGGALGASSILLIVPQTSSAPADQRQETKLPQGIVVSIITNIGEVKLSEAAIKIAEIFHQASV